jgi:hypothetical protein
VKHLKSFALFWVDFIIGDDYWVAAGIVATLGLCAAVSKTSVPAWWLAPLGVLGILTISVIRGALGTRKDRAEKRAAEARASSADGQVDATGGGHGPAARADAVVQELSRLP